MKGRVSALLLSTALGLALVTVMAVPAGAGSTVIPPHAKPVGASYGQWGARWWQWLYQTPVNVNPEFSPPGTPAASEAVDCTVGQTGHVSFIGGTFLPTSSTPEVSRSDVYRTCSIPSGTFLFFPILNGEFDNLNCIPGNTNFTGEQLTAQAAQGINDIVPGSMTATIDGAPVSGLADGNSIYRAPSPWFSYTFPADNVGQFFGCNFPAGTQPPTVDGHPGATADGIYLMLAPLSPGTHVIHFGGEINIPASPPPVTGTGPLDFIQNINYTITVAPR
jgi:hypothetical protein